MNPSYFKKLTKTFIMFIYLNLALWNPNNQLPKYRELLRERHI